MSKKPLLELVMIVKNSGEEIIPMLESVKKFIDHWTILDTGSTDTTKENIIKIMSDVPGKLHDGKELFEDPFVDFSTARNRALDLATSKCEFSIMLDDTYHIVNGKDLRKSLKRKRKGDAFYIVISDNERSYPSIRVLRTKAKLRYKHKIHENVDCEVSGIVEGTINDVDSAYMQRRSGERLDSDITLLIEELEKYPGDRRLLIHLARSFVLKGEKKKSMEIFTQIIDGNEIDPMDYESRFAVIQHKNDIRNDLEKITELAELYPEEIEPAYLMALCMKSQNELEQAFGWILKAANAQPKNTNTVRHYIHRFEIPYIFVDICLATQRIKVAEKVLKTYIPKYKDPRLINIVHNISNIQQSGASLNAPIIVFHTSDVVEGWSPGNLRGKGKVKFASGSEIMAIELTKSLAKLGFRVFVFGKFEDTKKGYNVEGMYGDVQYVDSAKYEQFISSYVIDILIVSRDTGNLRYHGNVKKVFLWLHDIMPFNHQCKPLLHVQYHAKKFKKILCLCNWHKNYVSKNLPVDKTKISVTRNAISTHRFARRPKKIPYRFIYASGPGRGLEHLLAEIPKIKVEFPDTTLHVFTNLDSLNHKNNNDLLKKMISELPYVTLRGRVTQDEIAHEFLISDVWFYPTDFTETYCITALEAQAAGLLCACSGISSLPEIVGSRGIIGGNKMNDERERDDLTRKLINTLKDPQEKNTLTSKAREWAMNQDFDNLAKNWKEKLFCL